MPKGLPASYIKKSAARGGSHSQIFKRAWRMYKQSKVGRAIAAGTRRRKSRKRRSNPKRKVKRRMARRRRRKRRYSMTIPLAPMIGLIAGLMKPIDFAMKGDYPNAIEHASMAYTGFSPRYRNWKPERLISGVVPLIAGLLVHKFVGGPPLNLNKILARAKVPFIRI